MKNIPKITIVYGSDKDGSSAEIARYFKKLLLSNKFAIEEYYLKELNFKSCYKCDFSINKLCDCKENDIISNIFENTLDSKILVLASGVYACDLTDELVTFNKIFFSYLKYNKP